MSWLRIDSDALARETSKIVAEANRLRPRQYARGGPVMRGAAVIISNGLPEGYELPPPASLDPPKPTRRYYAGDGTLDRLIADPVADIGEVVREVERLCDREAHAAKYYREHPELLGNWHPWLEFVKTGQAAYLGWEPGQPRPLVAEALCDHRKLLANLRVGVGVALFPKVCAECGGQVLWP